MKVSQNNNPVRPVRKFKKGDIIQDVKNPMYVYLLISENHDGGFLYVMINTHNHSVTLNGYGPYNFNTTGTAHKLFEGQLILENES